MRICVKDAKNMKRCECETDALTVFLDTKTTCADGKKKPGNGSANMRKSWMRLGWSIIRGRKKRITVTNRRKF